MASAVVQQCTAPGKVPQPNNSSLAVCEPACSSGLHVCFLLPRRLAPVDYHRLHTPVTGVLKRVSWAGRTLYAVEVNLFDHTKQPHSKS
jgi:phosphatidylserine decarboxylase